MRLFLGLFNVEETIFPTEFNLAIALYQIDSRGQKARLDAEAKNSQTTSNL